jgi:hypothetical protein
MDTNINVDELISIFKQFPDIFPKGYFAYLKGNLIKKIQANELIFIDGVMITFKQYKRQTIFGDYAAIKGDYSIEQILNKQPGNGNAQKVLNHFFSTLPKETNIWLSVREDNTRAVNFYKKNGFIILASKTWSNGTIKGFVMLKKT